MRGWRKKLVFSLIIFFAGFAAGVYCAVPVPEDSVGMNGQRNFPDSALKSDQFARSFNARMHACLGVVLRRLKNRLEHVAAWNALLLLPRLLLRPRPPGADASVPSLSVPLQRRFRLFCKGLFPICWKRCAGLSR